VTNHVTSRSEYHLRARHIAGSHAEKLAQIDEAIHELLDLKLLECADDQPDVHFLAVPRPRSHSAVMTIVILSLLIVLVLLLGVHPSRAQTPDYACSCSSANR
jgi:hypothetical protein